MSLEARIDVSRSGRRTKAELRIADGETLALVGPNGAGKSTVVGVIAGLIAPDDSRVLMDGIDMTHRPPNERGLGVVFQDGLLFPHMSVRENISFGADGSEIDQLMSDLALEHLAGRLPIEISGGEAQRVALARALASQPRALILDEPSSALDVGARVEMRRYLASALTRFTGPCLLVTHDPTEAFVLADRVAVLEQGAVVQQGRVSEIRQHPRTDYVANLVGTNLLEGVADGHTVKIGDQTLTTATSSRGDVLMAIHPRIVGINTAPPSSTARNVWEAVIEHVEDLGDRARIALGPPLPLTAEVTSSAVGSNQLTPGKTVWVSVKATEIEVSPR